MIDAIIAEWLADGLAPETILNRYWSLDHMMVTLAGGKRAWTPLAKVDLSVLKQASR